MSVKIYNLSLDGLKRVSANFLVREFACRDGSERILICEELVRMLQCIRDYKGMPVQINSGYRTPAYNRRVGGALDSQHVLGRASDIVVAANSPRQVFDAINSGRVPGVDPGKIGLGLYRTFVHIDSRGSRARWAGKGVRL